MGHVSARGEGRAFVGKADLRLKKVLSSGGGGDDAR